jgi:hypothetical protein
MKLSIILKEALEFIHFHPSWPLELKALFTDSCYVVPNFASMSEEAALLSEVRSMSWGQSELAKLQILSSDAPPYNF